MDKQLTMETVYEALAFGKIIRLRGVQLWPGQDSQGGFIDVHIGQDNSLPALALRVAAEIKESTRTR